MTNETLAEQFKLVHGAFTRPSPAVVFLFDNVRIEFGGVTAADVSGWWTVSAGMNKTSPAFSVTGGLPSTRYSSEPSRT